MSLLKKSGPTTALENIYQQTTCKLITQLVHKSFYILSNSTMDESDEKANFRSVTFQHIYSPYDNDPNFPLDQFLAIMIPPTLPLDQSPMWRTLIHCYNITWIFGCRSARQFSKKKKKEMIGLRSENIDNVSFV